MSALCPHCRQAMPEFGGIAFDDDRCEVRFNGFSAYLTRQEGAILRFVLDHKGRPASKEAIFDNLYQLRHGGEDVEIKIVDVFICKLRKKLAPMGLRIGTSWGHGYYLCDPSVEREAA